MVTPFLSQTALHFGVNDLEGTVVREKIYHEAGAHTPQAMTLDEILRLIRGAGKVPAERDSFYNVMRTFDDDGGSPRAERGVPDARRTHSRTSTATRSTAAIDRGIVPLDAELVDGVPTALNAQHGRGRARRERHLGRRVCARRRAATCCCPTSRSRATARCAA